MNSRRSSSSLLVLLKDQDSCFLPYSIAFLNYLPICNLHYSKPCPLQTIGTSANRILVHADFCHFIHYQHEISFHKCIEGAYVTSLQIPMFLLLICIYCSQDLGIKSIRITKHLRQWSYRLRTRHVNSVGVTRPPMSGKCECSWKITHFAWNWLTRRGHFLGKLAMLGQLPLAGKPNIILRIC